MIRQIELKKLPREKPLKEQDGGWRFFREDGGKYNIRFVINVAAVLAVAGIGAAVFGISPFAGWFGAAYWLAAGGIAAWRGATAAYEAGTVPLPPPPVPQADENSAPVPEQQKTNEFEKSAPEQMVEKIPVMEKSVEADMPVHAPEKVQPQTADAPAEVSVPEVVVQPENMPIELPAAEDQPVVKTVPPAGIPIHEAIEGDSGFYDQSVPSLLDSYASGAKEEFYDPTIKSFFEQHSDKDGLTPFPLEKKYGSGSRSAEDLSMLSPLEKKYKKIMVKPDHESRATPDHHDGRDKQGGGVFGIFKRRQR
ncbi:MAG: hypothetical protein LBU87_01530 [Lactobacillales bacterium]|jgi:hypothetical protein|nr:hypothetical protein [Lactobacillales bacterium]